MRRIINIIAALTIVIGGWLAFVSGFTLVGLLLVFVGIPIFVWELFVYFVEKDWVPAPKIALTKATLKAYEKTQELPAGRIAEESAARLNGDILSWYATAFTQSVGVPLYGKKPPSTKLIEIPSQEFGRCRFENEANDFVSSPPNKVVVYTNLAMTRVDLRKCIKEIKTW